MGCPAYRLLTRAVPKQDGQAQQRGNDDGAAAPRLGFVIIFVVCIIVGIRRRVCAVLLTAVIGLIAVLGADGMNGNG